MISYEENCFDEANCIYSLEYILVIGEEQSSVSCRMTKRKTIKTNRNGFILVVFLVFSSFAHILCKNHMYDTKDTYVMMTSTIKGIITYT